MATKVGLIKFILTNKRMNYPITLPGVQGHCFLASAGKHINLIIVALLDPMTVPVVAELVCLNSGKENGDLRWAGWHAEGFIHF